MKTSRYKIVETDDGQFQYQLLAKNNKIILTSVKYKTVEDTLFSIRKTIEYGMDMFNFDFMTTMDNKFYFTVTENNDDVIAKSNLYTTEQSLFIGCNSVMDNCKTETINYVMNKKNG